jgi:antitoxin (DNA-binding transcriptional repressor) of toxin-antitoxin stability system
MREIGAFEAKNTLGSLLDLVERGEEVVITRRGKPVARLVRETAIPNRAKARRAAADIVAMRQGATLGPEITLKDLIDEGRE